MEKYKFNKNSIAIALVVSFVLVLVGPITTFAATTPSLGTAATFGVLGSTYTNTVAGTTINGNLGYTTGPAVVPTVNGTTHVANSTYTQAGTDQGTALTNLNGQACVSLGAAVTLSGTYTPGCYSSTGAMDIVTGTTVTLNGTGTYIFRPGGAFTTGANSAVTLTGGAAASDVFWTPTSATTLGANTIFTGTVIDAAGITIGSTVTWAGRALSFGGTVSTNVDTITVPATLRIIKQVVNTSGGVAIPSSFTLHVKLSGTDVAGSPASGTSTPGTSYSLSAGTYVVSEDAFTGYSKVFSGSCDANGTIILASGDDKTCTITNTDIPSGSAVLHVIKLVVNGNGGTATPSSFTLHVKLSGTDVAGSPASGVAAPGTLYTLSAGTYVVSENINTSYVRSFSGACDASGSVTLSASDDKICTIINTDIPVPPPVSSSIGVGGVIVPLIGILKVPTPLALPAGPGLVTYNYTVWNVGGYEPLLNVVVKDDKCGPVTFVSGDLNSNGNLDPREKWEYRCTTNLLKTTTNTAIATGDGVAANALGFHQPAIATAIATVVVGIPTPAPLINIVKVPSRLTPFAFGGGYVMYSYTVTNPGVVAMSNVVVTDDKCGPISGPFGDVNGNGLLDPGESWSYTCRTNVPVSTRNVAMAEGRGNGFTAISYAFATVLVAVPGSSVATLIPTVPLGFPSTGIPPEGRSIPWDVALAAGILVIVLIWLAAILKIQRI